MENNLFKILYDKFHILLIEKDFFKIRIVLGITVN